MNRIKGKLVLITGGSAGIGAACARRLASEGSNLALWARRMDRLEGLANQLREEHGVNVHIDEVDVRDRARVMSQADHLMNQAGVPEILINSAGLASGMSLLQDSDPEDW